MIAKYRDQLLKAALIFARANRAPRHEQIVGDIDFLQAVDSIMEDIYERTQGMVNALEQIGEILKQYDRARFGEYDSRDAFLAIQAIVDKYRVMLGEVK